MNSIVRVFSLISLIHYCFAELTIFGNVIELNESPDTITDDEVVERTEVKLYYESFCPYCRNFDTKELAPAVKKIYDYLEVYTYPYGNANTTECNGQYKFCCQHGPDECYGNKLHACALDIIPRMKDAILFNACMMDHDRAGNGSDNIAAHYCGEEIEFDALPIIHCAKNDKGDLLLKQAGDETAKVKDRIGVPWVMINGKELGDQDFWSTLCKTFENPPKACKE